MLNVENDGFVPLKKVSFHYYYYSYSNSYHLFKTPTEPRIMVSKSSSGDKLVDVYVNSITGDSENIQNTWEDTTFSKMNRGLARGNSFVGFRSRSVTNADEKNSVIVIVDPVSTGVHLAATVCAMGYRCARIFSSWNSPLASLFLNDEILPDYCATIQHNDSIENQGNSISEVIYTFIFIVQF